MNSRRLFYFLSIPFFVYACAPVPIATMKPVNTTTRFDWGSEIVSFNKNNLFLNVAYVRSTDAYFLFDVEVQNASGETKLISPEKFFYQVMTRDTLPPLDNRFPAVNPETKLLEINKAEAKENAESRTSYLLEFTSTMTDMASDIANINTERTQEEIDREERERNERQNNFEIEKIERTLTFKSLNEKRNYWENQMFRKSHIPHGYSLKGRVAFNRFKHRHPFLKFTFKIADEAFEVVYRHKLIHPNSAYND